MYVLEKGGDMDHEGRQRPGSGWPSTSVDTDRHTLHFGLGIHVIVGAGERGGLQLDTLTTGHPRTTQHSTAQPSPAMSLGLGLGPRP